MATGENITICHKPPMLFRSALMRLLLSAGVNEEMSYLSNGLSFNTLRGANAERFKSDKYKACQEEWTPAHWMQATIGELGELANLMKKVDRGDFTLDEAREEIAKEFADVQTYLDLMAFVMDIDLGKATIDKFNEVSERIGSRVYIGYDDDWHLRPESESAQ